MAWIVDVEFVSLDEADPPDALEAVFDVIYPGETWVRSRVRISAGGVASLSAGRSGGLGGEVMIHAVLGPARDALLAFLEAQPAPVSVDLRLTEGGTEILRVRRTDLG